MIMKNKEAIEIVDKMILQISENNKCNELWCSNDIYEALGVKIYKGFKIKTHRLMPKKEYAIIGGSLYF